MDDQRHMIGVLIFDEELKCVLLQRAAKLEPITIAPAEPILIRAQVQKFVQGQLAMLIQMQPVWHHIRSEVTSRVSAHIVSGIVSRKELMEMAHDSLVPVTVFDLDSRSNMLHDRLTYLIPMACVLMRVSPENRPKP